jgi:hypothetical protein
MPGALSKESVIERILSKHGDNIIIDHEFVYQNTKKKVKVLCAIDNSHGYFESRPETLMAKVPNGCPKCGLVKNGLSRRSTTKQFIECAIKIHGNKYDYSEVVYIKSNQNVIIKCDKGHRFQMTPNGHLDGHNCIECYRHSIRRDIHNLITTAQEIHRNKDGSYMFDYSYIDKESYKGTMYKVPIKCNQCLHIFKQNMNSHVHHKQGCWECNQRRSRFLSIEEIVRRGEELHILHNAKSGLQNGLPQFDYSLLTTETYNGLQTIVSLRCKGCNVTIEMTISDHLSCKKGCPRCSPPHGCSRSQLNWLNYIACKENIYIQHKCNEGEYMIKEIGRVDGYHSETNTVYEFHGCWFHGCPECFKDRELEHPIILNKTYEDLYIRTITRDERIRKAGYNLVVVWEHEWNLQTKL